MKTALVASIVCSLLALSARAAAQEVRVGGGVALPLEPTEFTDLYDIGFHGGLELTATVNKAKTNHLGIAAYHHRFPLDKDGALDAVGAPPGTPLDLSGGTYLITEIYGQFRADLSAGTTRPFLMVGVGFAQQDATDLNSTVSGQTRTVQFDSEEDAMLTLGFGVTHDLGGVSLFGQLRLTTIFSDNEDTRFVPITAGVAF